ncbi:glycosyltransferase family 2 protein [Dyadobacter tibetensis]|uniref:glycosyltransferase family 2 protein n=1 Tax=Dyadobacter tibetensis TaxID=1211851 RepID=UPI00046F9A37|nr:glycosyltransferase family 2 protein [Dyadobacter tibetensis]
MVKVSIITVNYNQPEVTEALIDSIHKMNDYFHIEVIVVDNGSRVDPVPYWTGRYPHILFIRSEHNLGFAGGNNLGIEQATGTYLFFVNNDTIFTPALVGGLASYLTEHPLVGMVSPKIHYFENPTMIQYAGYTAMNYYTASNACVGQFEEDSGQYDGIKGPTGFIHGAAMMVRRKAIEVAGLMPVNYFLYYEEFDWVEAIKRAGFEVHVNNDFSIYHKESISVGKNSALKTYFMNRNRILFIRRNTTPLTTIVFGLYFLLLVSPRNIIGYIRSGNYQYISVFFKAILWNFKNATNSQELGFTLK